MSNLTYKTGPLGIPGLSNSEKVMAPKQTDTSRAAFKESPYKSQWATFGETISKSLHLATSTFSAVTQYNRAKTMDIANKDKVMGAYETAAKNEVAATITKAMTEEAAFNVQLAEAAKENGKLLSPKVIAESKLKNFVTLRENLKKQLEEDKNLTDVQKTKLQTYTDSLLDKEYKSRASEVLKATQRDNVAKLSKAVTNRIGQEIGSDKVSLKKILNGNKDNIKALQANGSDVDAFDVLTDALAMFYDNKTVISKRYEEAKAYLESDEKITPGFMKYMHTLTAYKNNIEAKDAKITRQKEIAYKKQASIALKDFRYTPSKVNVSGVIEFGVKQGEHLDIHSLNAANDVMIKDAIEQIAPIATAAGKTPLEIEAIARKQVTKYQLQTFKNYLAQTGILSVPINQLPKEFKSLATEDAIADVNDNLNSGALASINEEYKFNPILVRRTVQQNLKQDMMSLGSIEDNDNLNNFRDMLKTKYNLDPEILYTGIDSKTRAIYETLMSNTPIDIKEFKTRMQELSESDKKYIKVPKYEEATKAIKKLPPGLQDKVNDYFKSKYIIGKIGAVTEDDVDNFVSSHTIESGVPFFKNKLFVDDNVIKALGDEYSENTKPLILKQVHLLLPNLKNLDGVTLEDYNGHTHIKKDGIVVYSVPTNDFVDSISNLHQEEINSFIQKKADEVRQRKADKAWNKLVDEKGGFFGSSKEGLGLGKEYIELNGKKVYKKDFEENYMNNTGG